MKRFAIAFLFFAGLLGIWHLLVAYRVWSPVLLPDPRDVGKYLIEAAKDGDLASALWVTAKRLLLGYFVGVFIGIPVGLLTARFQWAHDTIGVLSLGFQTLPSVCWVPLALLWFGQTESAMLFVVIMGTVWSVVIATDTGVRTIPPIYARAARTMGSNYLHRWIRVILPASLPYL